MGEKEKQRSPLQTADCPTDVRGGESEKKRRKTRDIYKAKGGGFPDVGCKNRRQGDGSAATKNKTHTGEVPGSGVRQHVILAQGDRTGVV
jgi:hypothetical protein